MLRYLALIWNDRSRDQSQCVLVLSSAPQLQSPRWRIALEDEGIRVYCAGSPDSPLGVDILPQRAGIVLGRTIRRNTTSSADALASATTADGRARALIETRWGRYVAILRDPHARRTLIVRDPSGAMRCFYTASEGVHVICSNTEDCVALGLRFTINWNYVAAELANRAAMGWEQTGLAEISAVGAGECLDLSDDSTRRYACWDPVRIAAVPLEDSLEAARQVRSTVRQCVQAWAAGHAHVGLLLSGGLDSSVILSCLSDAAERPTISCLNYFHVGARADERSYARLAAQRADCGLLELERSTDVRLQSLLSLPLSARPSYNRLDHVLHAERSTSWGKHIGVSALFTGDLGDQLFGQQLVGYAPMDCAWMHGVGRRLFATGKDLAHVKEMAVWSALFGAAAYAWFGRGGSMKKLVFRRVSRDVNPYLNGHALRRFDYGLRDRWFESVESLPLGKLYHIASVMSGQAYLTPVGGDEDPEWIAPLNSQPIIELCLRLPLYLQIEGGWNRGLLRRAFANDVPSEIVGRRTKGTTSTQRLAVYLANESFLRELLLEGVLADSGLLDVAALARDLDDHDYRKNLWLERCIRAETWLRTWDAGGLARSQVGQRGPHMRCWARYVYSRAS